MKITHLSFLLLAFAGFTSCDDAASKINSNGTAANEQAETVVAEGTPQFAFNEEFWDFGEIPEGELATHEFVFTNTGDAPLIISNARGSCGCTVPEWPNTPIQPGEQGVIKVSFNSNGRPGKNDKQVTLTANTVPNAKVLKITSFVQGKTVTKSEENIFEKEQPQK